MTNKHDTPKKIDARIDSALKDLNEDLAKMAQLIPVIGAPVGVVVNYRLITKLGETAMNAYRMRLM